VTRDEAIRYVVDQGQAQGFEFAVVFDEQNGAEYIRKTSRKKNSVIFEAQEVAVMNNPAYRLTLVHNHPGSSPLSLDDLHMATLPGVGSVVAAGHDGSVYEARAKGKVNAITAAHRRLNKEVPARIRPLLIENHITLEDANRLNGHIINLALDRRGLIEYRAYWGDGALGAVVARLDSIIDSILEAVV
jgi:hypothetical protein